VRCIAPRQAQAVHELLTAAFDDEEPDFPLWWAGRAGDPEFDPATVWLAQDGAGRLAGVCWCWSSGFMKDLAVAKDARRQGLGRALVLVALGHFASRGHAHLDLKTSRRDNADAYRLYRNLGFEEVAWGG